MFIHHVSEVPLIAKCLDMFGGRLTDLRNLFLLKPYNILFFGTGP